MLLFPTLLRVTKITLLFLGLLVMMPYVQAQQGDGQRAASEDVTLETKDGVPLKATFYTSNRGKDAVPVIMLHDHKSSRNEFDKLARFLQSKGHAVLTVDLRGHGGSTRKKGPGGDSIELDAAKLKRQDIMAIIQYDMEAVRKFLVTENDQGKLNINKLCVVGAGMGATVAVNWAAVDWSAKPLPQRKQGQDIKGLVLLSPSMSYLGVPVTKALRQPGVQKEVSMLILYGENNRKATRDAKRIHSLLAKFHPEPSQTEGIEKQELFIMPLETSNQGMALVGMDIDNMLSDFIDWRIAKQDFEWSKRRHGG